MRYWLAIPILLCSFARAQEQLVQTGPFGAPVMVADEGGTMRTAIVVYETANIGWVIPDITTLGWRVSYIAGFRKSGKYPLQLYIWYKNTKVCELAGGNPQGCADLGFVAQTLVVNTRTNTIHNVSRVLVDRDGTSDITTIAILNRDESAKGAEKIAIDRITKIVENESKGGRGN